MAIKMESTRKFRFVAARFGRFIKTLLRNKRGGTGVVIITGFVLIALFAPFITPYTSLGEDPIESGVPLGGFNTAPTWLRFLPRELGGVPTLSEGMRVIDNPGSPNLVRDGGEWQFFGEHPYAGAEFKADVNAPHSSGEGCLAITFARDAGVSSGLVTTRLFKEFDFPYSGPPSRFHGFIAVKVQGSVDADRRLHVPVKLNVYLEQVNGSRWNIWPFPSIPLYNLRPPSGFTWDRTTGVVYIIKPEAGKFDGWILATDSMPYTIGHIDSLDWRLRLEENVFRGKEPAGEAFRVAPGRYAYGVEIVFMDEGNVDEPVNATVYIDDFAMSLDGTAWGLMGTDHRGRDLFAQLVYGTRVSLYVGFSAAIIGTLLGLFIGLSAGFIGGLYDELWMRFADLLLVLPTLPLLIVIIAVLGARLENLILVWGLLGWMGFARLVRSQVLSLKERPFVEAAKALGAGRVHIMTRHILPNVMSLVYITLATSVPGAIVAEAALAWLGFQDPTRMSWGRMLYNVQFEAHVIQNWWWVIPPGLCIALISVAFILLGYALDDVLNPKLRVRR